MKTFILDIIPKIKRFSKKLDSITVLTNKHWVMVDEELENKVVFIFREKENQLLISENGRIEKGNWEYLGNSSLLIDRKDGSYLFKHGFVDDYVLALKIDGKEEYALLVNEQKFNDNLNSLPTILAFLNETYIEQKRKDVISIPKSKPEQETIYTYNKEIDESDKIKEFDSSNYPDLIYDIMYIKNRLEKYNKKYLAEILISFARDHKVNSNLANENPVLVEVIVNKKIPIGSIENLFSIGKNNLKFRNDLELFLEEQFRT